MARPAIDDRGGGHATIFLSRGRCKRKPNGNSPDSAEWLFRTTGEFKSAPAKLSAASEDIYRHRDNYPRVVRFPRLREGDKASLPTRIVRFADIPKVAELPGRNIHWLVPGLIPRGALVLLTAPPGWYKTWLALYLAGAVSRGGIFLDRPTSQMKVLYLDRDNSLQVVADRLDTLGVVERQDLRLWGKWVGDSPPLIGDSRLLDIAREHQPLMIFDPLLRFHTSDENSAKEMAVVMDHVSQLVVAGATVLMLHHLPKSGQDKARGSTAIHAAVDVGLNLSVDRRADPPPTLTLDCFKNRYVEEFELKLRPDFDHGQFEIVEDSSAKKDQQIIDTLKAVIRDEPGLCQKDVIRRSKLPQRKARKVLNAGEGIHLRVERHHGKEKTYYPI